MSERKRVDVDERLLQQMMAGEVPSFSRNEPVMAENNQPLSDERDGDEKDSAQVPETDREPEKEIKVQKRKRPQQDYSSLFFKSGEVDVRHQIYISKSVFNKMMKYFNVISEGKVNLVTYLNNILIHHMDEFKDEINQLYADKTSKPL